jgi:hypothetical protein
MERVMQKTLKNIIFLASTLVDIKSTIGEVGGMSWLKTGAAHTLFSISL